MKTQLITLIRHACAVLAGMVLTFLAGKLGVPVTDAAVQGFTETLTWIGVGLVTLVYAFVEKLLKPLTALLGEKG